MRFSPVLLFLLATAPLYGRDIHVGKEAPSLAHAIKAAQPGDTIHLEPKVYHDYAGFTHKRGELGKPITLDGHGATLDGSDAISPAEWREVSPNLYAHDHLLPHLDDAIIQRWYFLMGGHMQHMGRTSKGKRAPLKTPQELQAGEWTFVKDDSRAQPPSQKIYGTFYLKTAPGQTLAEANVAAPTRSAGVQLSGANAHLVIKNLTVTHVYNDGFNIHGDCRDVVFENIRAIECGDDGISAHESAQYHVEGFVSRGNSTGICDTGTARTSYNRVFISDCLGHDLFFLDHGSYKVTNAIVHSSAQSAFTVAGREGGRAELVVENMLFKRVGPPIQGYVSATSVLKATRLTLENMDLNVRGTAELTRSLLNGKPTEQGAAGADLEALYSLVPEAPRNEPNKP